MKKFFVVALILFSLLVVTTSTAFAGSALELVQVRLDGGVPTFIFRVTGEFSAAELEGGFVQVDGGEAFPLYCTQTDADTVVCHSSKKANGQDVVVGFGGAKFWTDLPEAEVAHPYCYNVYDEPNGEQWGNGIDAWVLQGIACQDYPASQGDVITFDSPYWVTDWDYMYDGEGIEWDFGVPETNPGPGYYFFFPF